MAFILSQTPTAGTGTISISAYSTNVTGVGTNFTGQALLNKIILINGHNALVTAVASATSMTINRAPSFGRSGVPFSFVNNGTTINQTGTDANPSGLAAITGVFNLVDGTAPSIQSFDVGQLALSIQGTLTIPDLYWIKASGGAASNVITVTSTGKLVIDGRKTLTRPEGTITVYSLACGIIIRKPSGVPFTIRTIQFDSGSQFEQYGGILETSGAVRWITSTTSLATFREATWYVYDRNGNGYMNVYIPLTKPSVDGWKLFSNDAVNPGFLSTLDPGFSIKGFEVIGGLHAITAIDGTTAMVRLDNFIGGFSRFDFQVRVGGTVTDEGPVGGYDFYNANIGNNLQAAPNATTNNTTGRARHYVSYTPTFLDSSTSSGIVGGILYQKDSNSGSRVTNNGVPNDKIYINTSGTGGVFPQIELLTKVWSGLGFNPMNQDNRLPINGYFWDYNQLGTPVNITSSIGPQLPTLYAPADTGVTLDRVNAASKLASSFTIDRITNNVNWLSLPSTLDDWYDSMKAYKCATVQEQLEYPTLSTRIVESSGTVVSTSIQQTINIAQTQGAKFTDLSSTKAWIIANGGTSSFDRGTLIWTPSTYEDQIRVQSGGTLNLTNSTLLTVNPTVVLGYGSGTTAMFRSGSTLNMSDSTVIYNIVSNGSGTVFSNTEAGSTWNISNSIITLNCPNNAQVAIHAYFVAASIINGLTINGTATNVVWQMGFTNNNSKMVNFKYGGAIFGNGTSNILMDTYTYTGTSSTIPSNFGSQNKWYWVDCIMQNNGVFRYTAGSTPTGNNGFYGVIGFRPNIVLDKIGYNPTCRIKGSALPVRYPEKIFNTTEFGTVPLDEFFRDPTFMSSSDGFLPFVDSLDDKTTLIPIDWTFDFRQAGFIDQTVTFLSSATKKGTVNYTASGVADTNYVNFSTAFDDSTLIAVDTSTKTISAVSGNISWSPQRVYNALKHWWATYASDTDFLDLTGNGILDLGDYSTDSSVTFIQGVLSDALKRVSTTGTVSSTANTVPITDSTGSKSRLIINGLSTGMVVKLVNTSTGVTLNSATSAGSSVSFEYVLPLGTTSINSTLYVERATGQANGYNLYTNNLVLTTDSQITTAIMSIDNFYGRSAGRSDRSNITVTWDSATGAPTITLSNDTDVLSVYDVVVESHATLSNITYNRPVSNDGFTYQFHNAIFTGTGRLTGTSQFFTTGGVSIPYDLILNNLNTLNFLPNTWIKVIKSSDSSVLSSFNLNTTGKLELNIGTDTDYKVFLKKDGYKPTVFQLNSGTGKAISLEQLPQAFYNGTTDISTLTPKLDVTNNSGVLSIVSVGEMTISSLEVCAVIDYLQRDEDYADVSLYANTGDIWEITSQYSSIPDPDYIKIERDASLTSSQYTIWDTYFTSSSPSYPDTNITPIQPSVGLWVITNRSAIGEVTIKNEQALSISTNASEYVWSKVLLNGKTANVNVSQSNTFDSITSIEIQKTN